MGLWWSTKVRCKPQDITEDSTCCHFSPGARSTDNQRLFSVPCRCESDNVVGSWKLCKRMIVFVPLHLNKTSFIFDIHHPDVSQHLQKIICLAQSNTFFFLTISSIKYINTSQIHRQKAKEKGRTAQWTLNVKDYILFSQYKACLTRDPCGRKE